MKEFLIGIGLIVACLCGFGWLIYREDCHWDDWAKAHCQQVGVVYDGLILSGPTSGYLPDKTIYKCDDGATHIR